MGFVSGMMGAALFVLALLLVKQPRWTMSGLDVAYWGLVFTLVAVRFVASRRAPRASAPATPTAGWGRFALWLGVVAALTWIAAKSVQA